MSRLLQYVIAGRIRLEFYCLPQPCVRVPDAFDTEQAVLSHFDRAHGTQTAAGGVDEVVSDRELRARVAEARLQSKQAGSKANKQALKDVCGVSSISPCSVLKHHKSPD